MIHSGGYQFQQTLLKCMTLKNSLKNNNIDQNLYNTVDILPEYRHLNASERDYRRSQDEDQ